jgi:predicted RND superfamily exporter protein
MKTTTKLFATLLLIVIVQFAFASKPIKNDQTDLVKFRKHIISQIAFPSKIKNADGQQVTVLFEINQDMKAEICKIETENPAIEKFIRSEFESMEIPSQYTKINEPYSIKIKFNLNKNN